MLGKEVQLSSLLPQCIPPSPSLLVFPSPNAPIPALVLAANTRTPFFSPLSPQFDRKINSPLPLISQFPLLTKKFLRVWSHKQRLARFGIRFFLSPDGCAKGQAKKNFFSPLLPLPRCSSLVKTSGRGAFRSRHVPFFPPSPPPPSRAKSKESEMSFPPFPPPLSPFPMLQTSPADLRTPVQKGFDVQKGPFFFSPLFFSIRPIAKNSGIECFFPVFFSFSCLCSAPEIRPLPVREPAKNFPLLRHTITS